MKSRCDEGFVVEDGCDFQFLPNAILLSGRIRCLGGIEIDVFKRLEIVGGTGVATRVKRRSYNYHAQFAGGDRCIMRYDWPGHRPHHHRHEFDHFRTWAQIAVVPLEEHETPTLGEMIGEVSEWYWSNKDRIDQMAV